MPDGQVQSTAKLRCSVGIVALTLCVGAIGCQPSADPPAADAVRQKLKDAAQSRSSLSDSHSPAALTQGTPTEPVRRFAVRPFEEWTMRETAAAALGRIGKPAVPRLVEALQSSDPGLRHQAADTLARIGPSAAEAVPALIVAIDDQDPLVRKAAARALGQIGPDAAAAVPMLIDMLLEDDHRTAPATTPNATFQQ